MKRPSSERTFVRTGHGQGAGRPHVEVPPPDELPSPVPSPAAPNDVTLTFRDDGKIADSATAKELGRRGGQAKARRLRLIDSLGLAKLADDSAFAAYRKGAEEFTEYHLVELAKVAGGQVGPGPSTIVASAALQLAGSRYAFDRFAESADGSWMKLGSSLANDSRQNLLAAYSLAVQEAKARPASAMPPWFQNDEPKEESR